MSNPSVLESQQSRVGAVSARTMAGCWILPPRRALGLYPTQRARLRIERGGVWLTVAGRKGALSSDCFLGEGDEQVLEPGVHAVIEPWHGGRAALSGGALAEGVQFRWDPVALPALVVHSEAWSRGVVAPWVDLIGALRGAAWAAARLVKGLLQWAGAGRWAPTAVPRTCIDAQCE
ncbi:DUF2917 domain-containing protein [Acidovorax sp. SUPP2825]|uniref:DUF2917 domain-containing protein n=1 Tax=Acidovorax sp. SUPP2825 TaxID=2920879 RepID=UPI0023DE5046|nr:DUF2917 domain-containing protein [Acidovorax sp. SUPP2825]GKS95182.1 DUF2917 domain-containing protein [Acidovorax sp. SUPP2825]